MNLSEITTPAQLKQANEEPSITIEQALEVIGDFNPEQALALATHLVDRLRQFHVNISLREDCKNKQAWACDAGILAVALNCLQEIEI